MQAGTVGRYQTRLQPLASPRASAGRRHRRRSIFSLNLYSKILRLRAERSKRRRRRRLLKTLWRGLAIPLATYGINNTRISKADNNHPLDEAGVWTWNMTEVEHTTLPASP